MTLGFHDSVCTLLFVTPDGMFVARLSGVYG